MMSVVPDAGTIVTISSVSSEPVCSVCENKGSEQKCNLSELTLNDPTNTSVEFTCPRPQDVFIVEINREIGMRVKKKWILTFSNIFLQMFSFFLAKMDRQQRLTVNPRHAQLAKMNTAKDT